MTESFNTVCIIGLGYIGLPTAVICASHKIKVIGVDVNAQIVDLINSGEPHIVEPDLNDLLRSVVRSGHLAAQTTPAAADAFMISVPTPFTADHQPDLSYVEAATRSIAPVLRPGNLVVLESTSPVGTTEKMSSWLASARPDLTFPHSHGDDSDIRIAYCPERVLPGKILKELVQNDRVIGGLTPRCSVIAKKLYQRFVSGECLSTSARTAEMCKLTENSFRDVNIAFANELSMVCDQLQINVWELISLANRHPRVNILQPGPGVGGHCIAVDPWFIVSSAPQHARLIRTAREVNDLKPLHVIEQVKQLSRSETRPVIACLGLAFKPDIDDLRESPAVDIVRQLAMENCGSLLVVEPYIEELPSCLASFTDVTLVALEAALQAADIVLLLVDHQSFIHVNRTMLQGKKILDTRGVWQ